MEQYYYETDLDSFRYISHHGILGQKWGVRRYQNKDGTRTELGKKRRGKEYDPNDKKTYKKNVKRWTRDDEGRIVREPEYYRWAEKKRNELKEERAKKTDKENEEDLKAVYRANDKEDFDENGHDEQMLIRVQKEIRDYSQGDHGTIGVSNGAREWENKYDKWVNEHWNERRNNFKSYSAQREKLRLEGCGVYLKDIGFKDTERNRRYVYGIVFDTANIPIDDEHHR